jgi:TetR/AcrR family transcriptional regulator
MLEFGKNMPKPNFSALSAEKKERILRAATGLFAERGFYRTDMEKIASLAGVAKGSLYNYFHSKDDLFLHLCQDGIERFRDAVWGNIPANEDIYRQVEQLFRRQVPLILAHPQNFQIYLNLSSSGMKRFADRYSRKGEEFAARRLKKLLQEGITHGSVREDLDVPLAAFMINSLSIMFMASLISGHFQIRFKEYLDLKGGLNEKNAGRHMDRLIKFIHQFLRPVGKPPNRPNRLAFRNTPAKKGGRR